MNNIGKKLTFLKTHNDATLDLLSTSPSPVRRQPKKEACQIKSEKSKIEACKKLIVVNIFSKVMPRYLFMYICKPNYSEMNIESLVRICFIISNNYVLHSYLQNFRFLNKWKYQLKISTWE